MNNKFDLQLFSDAMDVNTLKSHGFTDEELQGYTETLSDENQGQKQQQNLDAIKEPPTEQQPIAPDGETVSKHVPYERFKEVNDKNKALKAELDALKAQIAQPVQQVQTPYQQSQAQQQNQPQNIEELIAQRAEQEVRAKLKITEDIDELQFTDPAKYRQYLKELAKAEIKIEQQIEEQQRTYYENVSFVQELQAKPNFQTLYNFALAELDELPGKESRPLYQALDRLNAGWASKEDIAKIRKFAQECEAKLKGINQAPMQQQQQGAFFTPNQQSSKLQQAADLPRSNQLNAGGGKTASVTLAQVEDLIRRGQIDQIPKEMLMQIDPRLLE